LQYTCIIWYYSNPSNFLWIQFSCWNSINDYSSVSRQYLRIWRSDIKLTMLVGCSLDCIIISYVTNILWALSRDTSILIQIEWMTVLSGRNHIFIYRLVTQQLPTCQYPNGQHMSKNHTTTHLAGSTHTSIHIPIKWMTVISILNDIFISG